jgi:parallel beta-helix repeat protein
MRLAIGAALVLAFAGTASAATTRKVPADYANIQAAEDACVDGDTILIAKGRYILAASVTFDVPNIKIVGAGAIVDGTSTAGTDYNSFVINAAGISVTGIKFVNGDSAIYCDGANLKVTKCSFLEQEDSCIFVNSGNGTIVEGCKFLGVEGSGIEAYVDNTRFTKNTFRSADSYGIRVGGAGTRIEGNTITFIGNEGVYVSSANNAVVLKNKLLNTAGDGIELHGNDVTIDSNTMRMCDNDAGIYVDGTSPFVSKNKVTFAGAGVAAYNAPNAEILGNKVVDIYNNWAGFDIEADNMTVVGNSAVMGGNYSYGFYLYGSSATGTGLIENNTTADMTDAGFYLGDALNGVEVRNCTAKNCGIYDTWGFYINNANGSTFDGLKVMNQDNTGIYITGSSDGNTFTRCAVSNCFSDGFRMQDGDDNEFIDCTAAKCGGEGFDNRGTNTQLTGGKYRGDRNDVANNTIGGATITLTNVDKVTPGTPQSQVD